jgi:BirA family transcriptional regulator, biotin operon repressor / biotin---[acetyl-CoA-carboxylase] ligase
MTATELERAAALAGLSASVHWQEVTGSTNADAVALALDGAPEWTLVGAGHQTAGRGRLGRTWLDRPGGSLMTSLVLRPLLHPDRLGLLTLLAGAAWAEAAIDVTGLEVRCKWPNDLVLDERKVGGLLAESSVEGDEVRWVVIGSGVNLADPGVEGSAGLGEVDPVPLLGGFLQRFAQGYAMPAAAFDDAVVGRWSTISATLGRRVTAAAADGGRRRGTAVAIDRAGRLVVETDDGRVAVASDEIEHLR